MVYLLMAHMGIAPAPWKKDLEEKGEIVPPWAQELQQYFNHDTTSHHTKTHELLSEISKKMDRHNEMEKDNHAKLHEILTYGVKCRDK